MTTKYGLSLTAITLSYLVVSSSVGMSPEEKLHEAAANGDTSELLAQLKKGADPNCVIDLDMTPAPWVYLTPLHRATEEGHQLTAELLLKEGANPNAQAGWGATPLDHTPSDNLDLVYALLIMGGHSGDYQKEKPLHNAACLGRKDRISEIVNGDSNQLQTRDRHGLTPLHVARDSALIELLRLGANPNDATPCYLLTTLHFAQTARDARSLIEAGAEVNELDYKGNTPHDLAVKRGNDDVLRVLHEKGAKWREALYDTVTWKTTP